MLNSSNRPATPLSVRRNYPVYGQKTKKNIEAAISSILANRQRRINRGQNPITKGPFINPFDEHNMAKRHKNTREDHIELQEIMDIFYIGQSITIKENPKMWCEATFGNNSLNLEYPFRGVIKNMKITTTGLKPDDSAWISLNLSGFGFCLSDEFQKNNIETYPKRSYVHPELIIETKTIAVKEDELSAYVWTCRDEEIKEAFIEAVLNERGENDTIDFLTRKNYDIEFGRFIHSAFNWSMTRQGSEYWLNIMSTAESELCYTFEEKFNLFNSELTINGKLKKRVTDAEKIKIADKITSLLKNL